MTEYSSFQIDALGEIANIGVGNAATAMSKMMQIKISISLPDTKIVPIGKFAEEVGGAEAVIQALYQKISGDLDGQALLVTLEKDALCMIDMMMGQEIGTSKKMGEMETSSFMEMSNILVGSYLNAVANMLELKILPEPALTGNDMAQAVLDAILSNISKKGDHILLIKTTIDFEGHPIEGTFVMLFEEESLQKILQKLSEKYELEIK